MILVLSCSLNGESNSRLAAEEARRILELDGLETAYLDLRDVPLPLCDGGESYAHPNVARVRDLVARANAVVVATPIYNYSGNAALKNAIELTGRAWQDKAVGFICAAGGSSSYMSIMGLATCLMLDFRCVIVPRFVYATGDAFAEGRIVDAEIAARVAELARFAAKLGAMLKAA